MKYLIASDLHGSLYYAQKMCEIFACEKADKLVFLGDVLYHGPRNPLPKDYNPLAVSELLNSMKSKIIAVRGNCDSEVDQMVLEYPIMADYLILNDGERSLFITHGHIYNEQNLPSLAKGDVLVHGHTHVRELSDKGDYYFLNPGSLSIPKGDGINGYAVLENGVIKTKDLQMQTLCELKL